MRDARPNPGDTVASSLVARLVNAYVSWLRPRLPLTGLYAALRSIDRPTATVLDVGCGKGDPAVALKRLSPHLRVVGIDIFRPYLALAAARGAHDALVQGDVRRLPFRDKSVDVVLCIEVLEHMTREEGFALLRDMERIAKHRVVVTTPVGHFPQREYDGNPYQEHRCIWTPSEMRALGYTVIGHGLRRLGALAHQQSSVPIILHPFIHLAGC